MGDLDCQIVDASCPDSQIVGWEEARGWRLQVACPLLGLIGPAWVWTLIGSGTAGACMLPGLVGAVGAVGAVVIQSLDEDDALSIGT